MTSSDSDDSSRPYSVLNRPGRRPRQPQRKQEDTVPAPISEQAIMLVNVSVGALGLALIGIIGYIGIDALIGVLP